MTTIISAHAFETGHCPIHGTPMVAADDLGKFGMEIFVMKCPEPECDRAAFSLEQGGKWFCCSRQELSD